MKRRRYSILVTVFLPPPATLWDSPQCSSALHLPYLLSLPLTSSTLPYTHILHIGIYKVIKTLQEVSHSTRHCTRDMLWTVPPSPVLLIHSFYAASQSCLTLHISPTHCCTPFERLEKIASTTAPSWPCFRLYKYTLLSKKCYNNCHISIYYQETEMSSKAMCSYSVCPDFTLTSMDYLLSVSYTSSSPSGLIFSYLPFISTL